MGSHYNSSLALAYIRTLLALAPHATRNSALVHTLMAQSGGGHAHYTHQYTFTGTTLSGSLPQANALSHLPTFTPTTSTATLGPNLLAAATQPLPSIPTPHMLGSMLQAETRPLTAQGPFNPTAALPAKVVKKILDLEFVEMAEVSLDVEPEQVPGRPPPPGRLPVTDISQWLERYSRHWHPGSPGRHQSSLPIRPRSSWRRGTMSQVAGWPMIDSSVERHWPARI